MARFRRRKDSDPTEDILRVVFALALLLALAVGGIGGFAQALTGLLVLGIFVLVVGFFGWLIVVSRFVAAKKAALLCLLGAVVTFLIWRAILPPEQWRAVDATITHLQVPKKVTRCVYRYEFGGRSFTFETTHEWSKKAGPRDSMPIRLEGYVDPSKPEEFSQAKRPGGRVVSASLVKGGVESDGPLTGTIRFGSGLDARTATVSGPILASRTVGSRLPIYINPANSREIGFEPQVYTGPRNYPLLSLSIGLLIVGVGLIAARPKDWVAALPPPLLSSPTVLPSPPPNWTTSQRLRRVDWFQFEKISERILKEEGWEVTRRGGANPDGGADLIARRVGHTAVVQCKFWKNWAVPPKVVRELLGTKVSSGFAADSAMLFALQCSSEARQFAQSNGITIYDEAEIVEFIDRMGVDSFPELMDPDDKACPKCGAALVRRESSRGAFWGCSQFGITRCRGKIEIEDDFRTGGDGS